MTRADAPAKMILFGEHAVVYGRPAIAVPIPELRASAVVEEHHLGAAGQIELISPLTEIRIWLHEAPPGNPLAAITSNTLAKIECTSPSPLKITIDSTIPVAAGLGSGAAVSVAVARALGRHFGVELDPQTLSALAYEVEVIHHGSPSGVDNTVIAFESPVFFIRGQTLELFTLRQPITVILAHSGQATPTAIAVEEIRKLRERDPVLANACFDEIGEITLAAYQALMKGGLEQLGELMNRNHDLLKVLGVSSPQLDQLVETALVAGANGAKLSGAGLGGYIIALVNADDAEAVFHALAESGASQLHKVSVHA